MIITTEVAFHLCFAFFFYPVISDLFIHRIVGEFMFQFVGLLHTRKVTQSRERSGNRASLAVCCNDVNTGLGMGPGAELFLQPTALIKSRNVW